MSTLVHAFTLHNILIKCSGIMDTVNSTLAHPQETRLPKEFYDTKGRAIIDKIGVEEWFSGYMESREYRQLGKSIATTFHACY
jgi:hypothetical protein